MRLQRSLGVVLAAQACESTLLNSLQRGGRLRRSRLLTRREESSGKSCSIRAAKAFLEPLRATLRASGPYCASVRSSTMISGRRLPEALVHRVEGALRRRNQQTQQPARRASRSTQSRASRRPWSHRSDGARAEPCAAPSPQARPEHANEDDQTDTSQHSRYLLISTTRSGLACRRPRCFAPQRIVDDSRADILQQPLKFGRREDDRPRRGAQAIDRLGRQDERRGLLVQVVRAPPCPGARQTTRRWRRSPLPERVSPRQIGGSLLVEHPASVPDPRAPSATAPRCPSAARPPRRNSDRSARPSAFSRMSTVPGGVSDSSQLVGGDDSELTTKTMILRTWSSGVGTPASCSASSNSSASSTPRMPTLSETPPSTRWMIRAMDAVGVGLDDPSARGSRAPPVVADSRTRVNSLTQGGTLDSCRCRRSC